MLKQEKPLKQKSYGSIGHLPCSRLGPSDSCVPEGQARICTVKTRDSRDKIIVQEKLDGSNVGVCLLDGEVISLVRAGYRADTSPYKQHHVFAWWVKQNEDRFRWVLRDGERICGEWLAQAHGTLYVIEPERDPFAAFDIMRGDVRMSYLEFSSRVDGVFFKPKMLWAGSPVSVADAMLLHESHKWPCDSVEGVVYRVERDGAVEFLAKYIRPDKIDGKYLPAVTGQPAVWNWIPECGLDSFEGEC